jgi:hypothetical protein
MNFKRGAQEAARGRRRGRARGVDGGAWMAWRHGEGDSTMAYRAETAASAA